MPGRLPLSLMARIENRLNCLKKRKQQMQYPQFQAQGWPIGSGIVENGNNLVVEARLKVPECIGSKPMLIQCCPFAKLRVVEDDVKTGPGSNLPCASKNTSIVLNCIKNAKNPTPSAQIIPAPFAPAVVPDQSKRPSPNPWRNFKHGKVLFQPSRPKL
jgi:hypothetical protein